MKERSSSASAPSMMHFLGEFIDKLSMWQFLTLDLALKVFMTGYESFVRKRSNHSEFKLIPLCNCLTSQDLYPNSLNYVPFYV